MDELRSGSQIGRSQIPQTQARAQQFDRSEQLSTRKSELAQIRQPRNPMNSRSAYATLVERERNRFGEIESIGTIFLTNRECPFACTMCDLWKNTLPQSVQPGDIPFQIRSAVETLPEFSSIKLYNSGNFFDARAIPPADFADIANLVRPFRNCIVENHPKLVREPCRQFASMIAPSQLEVALGLETCHEPSLSFLNKSMTLTDFDRAVEKLLEWSINVRVFLLLGLPDLTSQQSLEWTIRSIMYAASRGVDCFSVIPLRPTMPEVAKLLAAGRLQLPTAKSMEQLMEIGIELKLGRVFIDLWDAERFFTCDHCRSDRLARLNAMNLQQTVQPKVVCSDCQHGEVDAN